MKIQIQIQKLIQIKMNKRVNMQKWKKTKKHTFNNWELKSLIKKIN